MDHQAIKELLPLAALDWLEPAEALALEEHLRSGCEDCTTELNEFRETAALLSLSLETQGSEERIWARLESRLRPEVPQKGQSIVWDARIERSLAGRRLAAWRIASAVMAGGIVALAIYTGQLIYQGDRAENGLRQNLAQRDMRNAGLSNELVRSRAEVKALQQVLSERIRLERVLSAPDLRLTRLQSLAPAPGAGAIIAFSADNKSAVLQATGLPPTPPSKTYELWWITKEHGPVAAGLFQAKEGQPMIASVSTPPAGEHVLLGAVTLEPAGGVSKPTGEMYLKGAPGPA